MIKSYPNEKWKEVKFNSLLSKHYAISNFGRLVSYPDSIENARLIKGGLVDGYIAYSIRGVENDKIKYYQNYYHRLVAEYFLPKNSPDCIFVIHLDYNKLNNHFTNLKWVTNEEYLKHKYKSPVMIETFKKLLERNRLNHPNRKLTETQVIRIKKMLFNPNRKTRMKIIAKQFGISEMQLYRIKSGENWGHVTF